jgi:hypothetical protein
MQSVAVPSSQAAQTARSLAKPAFTLTVFVSAFLLFSIQPMFTKMILPQLGGTPAVWSVAMVFFQGLLLLGYLYAHISTTYLSTRVAVGLHLVLLLATFVALPISVSTGLGKPPVEGQMLWLIGVFALSVGLPFFAVAGNGPLLQAWFARTGHPQAGNPYFLYAASNLGSFAALLLYPVLFEITLRLPEQAFAWSAGFAALVALIATSGSITVLTGSAQEVKTETKAAPLSGSQIVKYVALSFVPSALLVAVTSHISTDVASAPFIWIVPLALFLLTFVLIFRDQPLVPRALVNASVPVLAGMILLSKLFVFNFLIAISVHLLFFFAAALMFHDRLYATRPQAERLTNFYLWMSFGGVLGGIFAGLLAPYLFSSILEYPILVSLVMLVHPAIREATPAQWKSQALPAAVIAIAALIIISVLQRTGHLTSELVLPVMIMMASCIVIGAFRHNLVRAVLIPATFILLAFQADTIFGSSFHRSFFGVYRISLNENGQFRVLSHGTTVHGAMRVANADGSPYQGPITPLTYYHPQGVLAETLHLLPANPAGRDIAIVGLGAGAQACNGQASDRFTYFEIDGLVEKIARDPKLFNFMEKCSPSAPVILGDARLTLADQPKSYDYLLLDAFSSDSIPVHLMTREAFKLYVSRLNENGLLVLHISNRHMELESVVAALAKDAGLAIKGRILPVNSGDLADPFPSSVMVLAKKPETLAAFTADKGWNEPATHNVSVWTDDYSNIASAIWRKHMGVN